MKLMNKENLIGILVVISLSAIIITGVLFGTQQVTEGWGTKHGDNKPTKKGCDWDSLKDYARSVDDMKCKGDDVELDKVLDMPGINDKQEKCLEHRADLGNELYEDEVMKCYKKHD